MAKLVTLSSSRTGTDGRPSGPTSGETPGGGFTPEPPEGGLNLPQLFNALRRRWGFIFGCTLLLTLAATILIFQLTPRYTAEATVMLDTRKTQVVDIQAVVSGLQSDAAVVRSEVEVLRSPTLAAKVVKKLNLISEKLLNPRLVPATIWSRIDPVPIVKNWILGPAVPPKAIEDPAREELDGVVGQVLDRLLVVNDGRSYIIKLRFECESPTLAAAVANAFVDQYLDDQLEAKFAATKRATDWLNGHLAELRDKVVESDRAAQNFREQHQLTTSKGSTVTSQQLTEINSQLILATADRAQKEANMRQVQEMLKSSGGAAAAAQVLASPVIQQLKSQQTDLRR
ncbi:MAG: GumC family protein, partial [Terriglobales bacterium]